jgi:hypothetical protein
MTKRKSYRITTFDEAKSNSVDYLNSNDLDTEINIY